MPSINQPIILGTRGSGLALAQAHAIQNLLRQAHPQLAVEIQVIKTSGDVRTRVSLSDPAGVKGLFTREIEVEILAGRADLGVHSLKDLPTALPEGLVFAAAPKRADPRDVLITRGPRLAELPPGATVATSSVRRKSQLLALRPDLRIDEIRGNVGTRLDKLKANTAWQGIVLAAAGLARLDLRLADWGLVAHPFSPEEMLPAPCQAIIGLETRAGDARVADLLRPINHEASFQAALAERAFAHALEGGCRTPVAAFAEGSEGRLTLRGAVFAEDGRARFRDQIAGDAREAARLGETLGAAAKAKMV